MTTHPQDDVTAAERWFSTHGLPWFVDEEQRRVSRRLAPRRLARVLALCAVPALAVGIGAGWWRSSPSAGLAFAATVLGLAVGVYAATALQLAEIAVWAGRRTVGQLGLLVPLVTRALPLLLIFIVFFFINTEVWQVASSLPPGVLWLSVLLFAALAVLFLIARLPEEVDRVVEEVDDGGLVAATRRTPLADCAARLAEGAGPGSPLLDVPLSRLERVNLLLVLLVVQAGQVLFLSLSVFGFFMLFGAVAIRPEIIESWLGTHLHRLGVLPSERAAAPGLDLPGRVLRPLLQRLRGHGPHLPRPVLHPDHGRAHPCGRGPRGVCRAATPDRRLTDDYCLEPPRW